jgi:hypothetical protein
LSRKKYKGRAHQRAIREADEIQLLIANGYPHLLKILRDSKNVHMVEQGACHLSATIPDSSLMLDECIILVRVRHHGRDALIPEGWVALDGRTMSDPVRVDAHKVIFGEKIMYHE